MTNPHGSWIWYELMTPDPQASKSFYEAVVGWTIEADPAQPGDIEYRNIAGPDGDVGGVLTLTPQMLAGGAEACWLGYIAVDDVDATVAALQAAGGALHMTKDIPGVGRIAMVSDPQGAHFYVMKDTSGQTSQAFARRKIGHVSWNDLNTRDDIAALDFYGRMFGWRKDGAMPMPWGDYSFLTNDGAEETWGAMMPREKESDPVRWNFYFRVPDIEAAHAKVKELGGTPFHDPMEVPGGERVFFATDPQGATFGLVAPK